MDSYWKPGPSPYGPLWARLAENFCPPDVLALALAPLCCAARLLVRLWEMSSKATSSEFQAHQTVT